MQLPSSMHDSSATVNYSIQNSPSPPPPPTSVCVYPGNPIAGYAFIDSSRVTSALQFNHFHCTPLPYCRVQRQVLPVFIVAPKISKRKWIKSFIFFAYSIILFLFLIRCVYDDAVQYTIFYIRARVLWWLQDV